MDKRLQFDFAPEAVDRLDQLVGQLHASSRAEVVRKALALLDRVVQVQDNGGAVVLREGTREREIVLL